MSEELSVGIVGLDSPYWPTAFAGAMSNHPDVTLAGFTTAGGQEEDVESNLGMSISDFEESYGLARLSDLDEVAAAVDAVCVCTRNTAMPDAIVGALERGLDVFAAKPVSVEEDELRAIRDAVGASDGVFTAGQTGRNHPAMGAVQDIVRSGRVGDVHTIRVMHQHWRYADWAAGTWYEDPTEGTACNWLGWYPIDVAVAILGPVVELTADGRRHAHDVEDQPDHLSAIVRHESDRTSSLDVYCDVGSDWEVDMLEVEVVGGEGVVRYRAPDSWISLHGNGGRRRIEFEDGDALEADLDAWIDACRGEGEVSLPGETALHVGAVGCAMQRSLEDDGWTSVEPVLRS